MYKEYFPAKFFSLSNEERWWAKNLSDLPKHVHHPLRTWDPPYYHQNPCIGVVIWVLRLYQHLPCFVLHLFFFSVLAAHLFSCSLYFVGGSNCFGEFVGRREASSGLVVLMVAMGEDRTE